MKYLVIFFLLALTSCLKEGQSSEQNGNFKITLLFEQDGCKVYRFWDGRAVYFSDCSGKIESSYSSGGKHKTTHYTQTLNN